MSKIVQSLAKIMGEVGSVKKEGNNAFHNYKYAQAADVMHKLQPLLAREGLVIFQTEAERNFVGDGAALAITYEFILSHKDGETWPEKPRQTGMAAARNSKGGFDDKAANKCHTAARKYFLLALFQIPTGDYDDADAQEDGGQVTPVKRENPHVTRVEDMTDRRYRTGPDGKRIDWIDTSEHRVQRLTGEKAKALYQTLKSAMRLCDSVDDLIEWGIEHAEQVAQLGKSEDYFQLMEYQDFLDELRHKAKRAA